MWSEKPESGRIVDTRFFPVVYTRLPEAVNEANLSRLFADTERALERRQPFLALTDTSALREVPNAITRRAVAEWMGRVRHLSNAYTVCAVIIEARPLLRGATTALFWISSPEFPHRTAPDARTALVVAREEYEARGFRADEAFHAFETSLVD